MSNCIKSSFIVSALFSALISCNHFYKAGNLIELGYPIETPIRSVIIRRYLDTLVQNYGYAVPTKWLRYDKLVDLDSIYHRRIYFSSYPEEMYLLSFGGMPVLSDVFNPEIREGGYVAERSLMSKDQELRVKERLKKEILDRIEEMAKRDGLPDSVIYKQ